MEREITRSPLEVTSDPEFKAYFKQLQQVFIYVTDNCNLSCEQCLYKPLLRRREEFRLDVATSLLAEFRKMGADKLSVLGGEPTTYKHLPEFIRYSKETGYKYVRMDTNGQFDPSLLDSRDIQRLDEITFSLDGDTPGINDPIRGSGTFAKCLGNIKKAVSLGLNVNITCCVHKGNIGCDEGDNLLVNRMIYFAHRIGVKRINFHPLFRMGVPRDDWAGDTDISPDEWGNVYSAIEHNADSQQYEIPVRIPQRFIKSSDFENNPAYFGYCPVKMGERVLVHPNGQIQICALMIGTPFSIAHYAVKGDAIKIAWEHGLSNELSKFDLNEPTPCTNQTRNFGSLVPLCISFKPNQQEYIWEKLDKGWVLRFQGPVDGELGND